MRISRIGVLVLFIALATRLAWLSDDSLITLRTALNITHGWGAGFNATEAVQGYTHPLWFLLWTLIGAVSHSWVLGILAASIALSAIAVGIALWKAATLGQLVIVAGFLLFSNAFMEYSTSGLENPLSYLFISIVFLLSMRIHASPRNLPIHVAIITGLAIAGLFLTRMDLALIIAPVALYLLWLNRKNLWTLITIAAATTLPILIWFAWSRLVYSTWLPNTFTAKSNLDIARDELLIQGFKYLWVSFTNDPVTFIGIIAALIISFTLTNPLHKTWATGIVLYVGYVWWIGGDFMAGRFFAVPLLVSVLIIATLKTEDVPVPTVPASLGVLALVLFASLAGSTPVSLTNPQVQRWEASNNLNGNVVDERSFYVQNNRDLVFFINNTNTPSLNPLVSPVTAEDLQIRNLNEINEIARNWPTASNTESLPDGVLAECGLLGTIGLSIGPRNHLVDTCALTDRVLASIAFTPDPQGGWKPGHFERELPAGYLEAVENNNPDLISDPALIEQVRILWEKIRP